MGTRSILKGTWPVLIGLMGTALLSACGGDGRQGAGRQRNARVREIPGRPPGPVTGTEKRTKLIVEAEPIWRRPVRRIRQLVQPVPL